MNTDDSNRNSQYLLLIRGTDFDKGLSPAQLQEVMGRWAVWCDGVHASGKLVGAQPLIPEGKVVSGKGGKTVIDGAFAESKEAIGGYFLLELDTIDEAIAIAQANPLLEYGLTIEVRPVAVQCPAMQKVSEMAAQATV